MTGPSGQKMDIIDFIRVDPLCKRAKEWGIFPQFLTKAIKQYGLEKVHRDITEITADRSVRNKAYVLSKRWKAIWGQKQTPATE